MTRNAALTVLLPGARIAPTKSTCTWGHRRLENSGTKGLSRCSIVVGRVRIITSLWRTGDGRTLPFFLTEWIKSSVERLSEKGKRSLPCSLTEHQNGTFRPIFASQHVQIRAQSVVRTPFRTVSPLDFIHSGRIAKHVGQVLYELPRDFYRIGVCGRLAKSRLHPQLLSHQRQSIRESRAGFAVPRSLPDSPHASRHSLVGEQGNDREQPQQRRCGPSDC